MNREEYKAHIRQTFDRCLAIVDKKSNDYSSDEDPFSNFKNSEIVHVPVAAGILVRIIDKISRMGNLLLRPAAVIDETIEDSIMDAINYLAILLAWLHSRKG